MNTIPDTRYPSTGGAIEEIVRAKVILAPMAGVSDAPFRLICRGFGCEFYYTEMIDVNGIVYNNRKTLRMLEKLDGEGSMGVQLVGQDEEKLARVARLCQDRGFPLVDLNAGCPARKIIKGGKGAALLRSPAKLARIIRAMVKAVTVPVTVKIRSGWDSGKLNYLEVAKAAESEGAGAVCVHARTKAAMYRGASDHNVTRELKENLKIPVIASGGVFSPQDAAGILASTGCDAVAMARGALGRPWIFRDTYTYLSTGKVPDPPSFDEVKRVMAEHFRLSQEHFGAFITVKRMYKHLTWYFKGLKNLDQVTRQYLGVKCLDDFTDFLEKLRLLDGKRLTLA